MENTIFLSHLRPSLATATSLTLSLLASLSFAAVEVQTASVLGPDIPGGPTSLAYAADVNDTDLINAGQSSLVDFTSTPTLGMSATEFRADNANDGVYTTGSTNNVFFSPALLPAVITYNLNTTAAPEGYALTEISSFMGWALESPVQCHQIYTVEVSLVGSASYSTLATVNYRPFTDSDPNLAYESRVRIIENSATVLASGVDSIRFTFSDPGGGAMGGFAGTVIREIDVEGFAVGGDPSSLAVNNPSERQIIQRNAFGNGNIPVTGTFISSIDRIEARAVVRADGESSGSSTDWQTIEVTPTGGTFSGALNNVSAGGWYDIEVRSVIAGTPGNASVIERVGIGDIYITAGQSNAANSGSPAATPSSDRVSARAVLDENTWQIAADPQPVASGTGGSPWSRLGDLLVASEGVPIGFLSVGRLSSSVSDWTPGNQDYLDVLKPAVQAFPANGFRALLWHQGEADSSLATSENAYRDAISQIVSQSRIDAGWSFPWYLAEASYQPSASLSVEEPVVAGQRAAAFNLSDVFLGSDTNDFHLEGKSSDGVHFNGDGLADHASQWSAVLTGSNEAVVRNGNFELNTLTSLTGQLPLADNGIAETNPSASNSPSVLDWRILRSNGASAANGLNGYFNPGSETYSTDPSNLPGPHAATISGGSAGNNFLQTLRARAQSNKVYFLRVSLGKRDVGSGTFGGARIELLNGRDRLEQLVIDEAALDARAGGSADGKFTNVTLRVDTGILSGQPHELGIRISKINGGAGSYLDFDNVVLSEINSSSNFIAWLGTNSISSSGPNEDNDGDNIPNLVEYALGNSPTIADPSDVLVNRAGNAIRLTRRTPAAAGLAYSIERSTNLDDWEEVPLVSENIVSTNGDFQTVDLTRNTPWVGNSGKEFIRLKVEITD